MTTIAYKDGVLAADTAVNIDTGDREGTTNKLARSPAGSIASAAGSAGSCALFLAMVQSGGIDSWLDNMRRDGGLCQPLDLYLGDQVGFGGLYVHYSGTVYVISQRGLPHTYTAPFYAEGSGHEYAKGAMSAGATASEAVAIAARFDHRTNDDVRVLKFKGG
jgi:hypothetical protein